MQYKLHLLLYPMHSAIHMLAPIMMTASIRCRFSEDLFELNLSLYNTLYCIPAFDAVLHDQESYTTGTALFFIFVMCHLLLQLYKTRDEKYLLDLQRVSGPQLLFLDLCAAFLAQLRVLWFPVSAFHQTAFLALQECITLEECRIAHKAVNSNHISSSLISGVCRL
jgi:hypothetical protein